MPYVTMVVLAAGLTIVIGWLVRTLALRWNIVDNPATDPSRKRHKQPVPLLGGMALFVSFSVVLLYYMPTLTQGYLLPKHIAGIVLAGFVLMVVGVLDDRFQLSPKAQILFPVLAAVITVAAGIGITYISNPLHGIVGGGLIELDVITWQIFELNGLPYSIVLLADLFTILWLMGTMYTTKLLDGLDGLVPGITAIGGIIIGVLSLTTAVSQPETASLAFIVAGTGLGFLVWNFSPAKLYLGEGGALWCGYMLGVLAILSGGKIATALLILGLPIIDAVWVIARRAFIEKKSIFSGDTLHLHFQLQDFGLQPRTIVLLYYLVTLLFGLSTLFVSGTRKVIILVALVIISLMALLATLWLSIKREQK